MYNVVNTQILSKVGRYFWHVCNIHGAQIHWPPYVYIYMFMFVFVNWYLGARWPLQLRQGSIKVSSIALRPFLSFRDWRPKIWANSSWRVVTLPTLCGARIVMGDVPKRPPCELGPLLTGSFAEVFTCLALVFANHSINWFLCINFKEMRINQRSHFELRWAERWESKQTWNCVTLP